MATRMRIEDLARIAAQGDAAAFIARFPAPALLVAARSREGADARIDTPTAGVARAGVLERTARSPASKGETVSKALSATYKDDDAIPPELQAARDAAELRDASEVLFLEKSERNPFTHMFTIGRAPNNDLVIAHPSVSKIHAYFMKGATGWTLTDQRSTNGTFVEGRRVEAGGAAPVPAGSSIRLGSDVRARFLEPAGLFAFLAV